MSMRNNAKANVLNYIILKVSKSSSFHGQQIHIE